MTEAPAMNSKSQPRPVHKAAVGRLFVLELSGGRIHSMSPDGSSRKVIVTESVHPYIKAWWPPGHIIGYEHTFVHTVYDLLEAMADGTVPTPNFEDGVRNQRVLGAIEKAAARRRWVALNP